MASEDPKQKTVTKKAPPRDLRERTFAFAVQIVKLCRHLELRNGVARTLSRQLLRAGTSIGADVEEAQAAQSRPDFINKNGIALKEAHETHYWVAKTSAEDCGHTNPSRAPSSPRSVSMRMERRNRRAI